tara:strand:+ start:881 stop:1087 length:207 start_codon:yes stop_codon:yes gene_type:complete
MKARWERKLDVVNDDGSEVDDDTKKQFSEIITLLQESQVLGPASSLNITAAIRIAEAILSRYTLTPQR